MCLLVERLFLMRIQLIFKVFLHSSEPLQHWVFSKHLRGMQNSLTHCVSGKKNSDAGIHSTILFLTFFFCFWREILDRRLRGTSTSTEADQIFDFGWGKHLGRLPIRKLYFNYVLLTEFELLIFGRISSFLGSGLYFIELPSKANRFKLGEEVKFCIFIYI